MQPAYYLGRRVIVFRASSHPVIYVYTWTYHVTGPRLAKTEAYEVRNGH